MKLLEKKKIERPQGAEAGVFKGEWVANTLGLQFVELKPNLTLLQQKH